MWLTEIRCQRLFLGCILKLSCSRNSKEGRLAFRYTSWAINKSVFYPWLFPTVRNQRPNLHWTFSLKAVISETGDFSSTDLVSSKEESGERDSCFQCMHSLLPKGIKLNNCSLSEKKKNQWRKISVHRVIQNLILFCMKNKNKFGFVTSKNLWNFALIYFLSLPSTTCWGCSIHVLIKRLNYTGSLSLRAHENKYLLKSLRCGT